ncbi:hypothetical protein J6590_096769 [Homalodisca vitripennis]|nr:hypothetical protein J6590_096769 [Homalodisca vitripennis]
MSKCDDPATSLVVLSASSGEYVQEYNLLADAKLVIQYYKSVIKFDFIALSRNRNEQEWELSCVSSCVFRGRFRVKTFRDGM